MHRKKRMLKLYYHPSEASEGDLGEG